MSFSRSGPHIILPCAQHPSSECCIRITDLHWDMRIIAREGRRERSPAGARGATLHLHILIFSTQAVHLNVVTSLCHDRNLRRRTTARELLLSRVRAVLCRDPKRRPELLAGQPRCVWLSRGLRGPPSRGRSRGRGLGARHVIRHAGATGSTGHSAMSGSQPVQKKEELSS